jgi:hypothetical protein
LKVKGDVPDIIISSLIQLPTDIPPQLMPVPRLCAILSRLALSFAMPFIEIGRAPCSNLAKSSEALEGI